MSISAPVGALSDSLAPHLSVNPITDLNQLIAYPFMVSALEAGTIVAVMAGVVGWFMVLRREAFVGHTLSIMAFPGASGAALVGLPLATGYFAFAGVGALVIAAASRTGGRRDDAQQSAVIGAVQAFGLASGFLFLSLYGGIFESLETLLFGSITGITRAQVLTLLAVAVAALAVLQVAGRRLLFASLDEEVARAGGIGTGLLGTGFLVVLGLAVAATAQITGVLLVFALLVAPAATAQELTGRIAAGLCLSVAIALLVTWVGLGLAYFTDGPVGFFVTTLALALYVAARTRRAVAAR
jgi:zinc/manganese transport system permease protein